jgi:hypothetical protein
MCQERVEIPKEILIRPKRKTVYKRVEQYEINEDYAPAEPPINEVKPAAPRSGDFAIVEPDEPAGAPEPAPAKRQGEFASASQQNTAETRKPAEKPKESGESAEPQRKKKTRRGKDLIPVECLTCNNRMYARKDQVGEKIGCPDCGSVLVVPPPRTKPKVVLPRPEPVEVSPEEPPPREYDDRLYRSRMLPIEPMLPDPPRWTFFSGVVSFLWRGKGPFYFGLMSLCFLLCAVAIATALWMQDFLATRAGGGMTAGRGGLALALVLFIVPVCWALTYAAACFLSVIQETANGVDEIDVIPEGAFLDQLNAFGRLAFLAAASAALGFPFGQAAAILLGGEPSLWAIVGALLFFPFLIMSSLESQRTLWPFSAVVFASLGRLWWGWLLVYCQTGAMFAACAAAFIFSFGFTPFLTPLWAGPVFAAAILIAARLYGRLLWRTMWDAPDKPPEVKADPWV